MACILLPVPSTLAFSRSRWQKRQRHRRFCLYSVGCQDWYTEGVYYTKHTSMGLKMNRILHVNSRKSFQRLNKKVFFFVYCCVVTGHIQYTLLCKCNRIIQYKIFVPTYSFCCKISYQIKHKFWLSFKKIWLHEYKITIKLATWGAMVSSVGMMVTLRELKIVLIFLQIP